MTAYDNMLSVLRNGLPSRVYSLLFETNAPARRDIKFLLDRINAHVLNMGSPVITDTVGQKIILRDFNVAMVETEIVILEHKRDRNYMVTVPVVAFFGLFFKPIKRLDNEFAPWMYVKINEEYKSKITSGLQGVMNMVFLITDPETIVGVNGIRTIRVSNVETPYKSNYCIINDFAKTNSCYVIPDDFLQVAREQDYNAQWTVVISNALKERLTQLSRTNRDTAVNNYQNLLSQMIQAEQTLKAVLSDDLNKDINVFTERLQKDIDAVRKMPKILSATVINPFKISVITDKVTIRSSSGRGNGWTGWYYNIVLDFSTSSTPSCKVYMVGNDTGNNHHPHVRYDGGCCWGELSRDIQKALSEYNVIWAVTLALQLLESYTAGDAYMQIDEYESLINSFPAEMVGLYEKKKEDKEAWVVKDSKTAAPRARRPRRSVNAPSGDSTTAPAEAAGVPTPETIGQTPAAIASRDAAQGEAQSPVWVNAPASPAPNAATTGSPVSVARPRARRIQPINTTR